MLREHGLLHRYSGVDTFSSAIRTTKWLVGSSDVYPSSRMLDISHAPLRRTSLVGRGVSSVGYVRSSGSLMMREAQGARSRMRRDIEE